MESHTKRAILYTALVCPGLGQWLVGRKKRAVFFAAWALCFVGIFGYRLFRMIVSFYHELNQALLETGGLLPDPDRLQQMHAQIYIQNWWVLLAILVVWAWAIADLYPGGR